MKKYKANFESLRNYEVPEWFKDAKFGIWSIWSPQTLAMCEDWYARNMYIQDTPQYLYHLRTYGHPSEFGFKDMCDLWKAENFNPDQLMEKYYKAGARYFCSMAMHHDHFFNYDSDINPMNSTKVGPMKDICGMWKKAAEKFNMPFGITEHYGATFSWWTTNKGCDSHGPYKGIPYDGNNPEYSDYYFDNYEHVKRDEKGCLLDVDKIQWYTDNEKFHKEWVAVMKEIIDKYEPELLYTDGGLPFGDAIIDAEGIMLNEDDALFKPGLEAVAYYYNKSIEKYGKNNYVYTQKDRREKVYSIGVLDLEKSQLKDALPHVWQTDTCIGAWYYGKTTVYKRPGHIIEMLVDIVAKNGTILMNIVQRPDGSIDREAEFILDELAKWFKICGEGIHGTRPWVIPSEGSSHASAELFNENRVEWKSEDFRFTKKGNHVYAFMLSAPENGVAILKSFMKEDINKVTLLGYGDVEFSHTFGLLTVQLPKELPTEYTNCLMIEV